MTFNHWAKGSNPLRVTSEITVVPVAKLVDARDLKSLGETCVGSIPTRDTN